MTTLGCLLVIILAGQADAWKLDTVYREGREPLKGLLVRQGAEAVEFKQVVRRAGSPTLVFALTIRLSDIKRLELIDDADRAGLIQKLERLENDRRRLFAHLRRAELGGTTEDLPGLTMAPAKPWLGFMRATGSDWSPQRVRNWRNWWRCNWIRYSRHTLKCCRHG